MTGTLHFDPDCGFCTRAAGLLVRLGVRCRVVPWTGTEPHLDHRRAAHEIPFTRPDGTVTHGAAAIADALRTAPPPLRWAGAALGTRGARLLADPVYRWVARHRHRLPGGTSSCRLP